ncbi:SAM-dependent methyltransferase [Actinoplanes philippinensis]|uniref:SAM-dependent methyltransferase n=1 Tax=Actinoplanes philippinensis TaxID=35752 RepID=UPI003405AEC4
MTEAPPPGLRTDSGDPCHDTAPRRRPGSAEPRWIPEGTEIVDAAPARVYNYAVGGMHCFRADRELWDRIEGIYPPARRAARANREVLERVTEWISTCGIRQFLDIGAGIPVLGATHETLRDFNPDARVVYVDIDPIAVEQARDLLRDEPKAYAVRGDLLDPNHVVYHDAVMSFLDFGEPVAVILGTVLQFITDDAAAARSISGLAEALAPGSLLVITHAAPDPDPEHRQRQDDAYQRFQRHTPTPAVLRTADQVAALIDPRCTLLPPGIVTADQWQAEPDDNDHSHWLDGQPPPSVLVAVARLRSAREPAVEHTLAASPASPPLAAPERGGFPAGTAQDG